MEISDFANQFSKLKEKELEQRVWEFWLVKYPHMTEDTFVSYEDMLAIAKQQGEQEQEEEAQGGLYADQAGFF
jgi:hypothetical protein